MSALNAQIHQNQAYLQKHNFSTWFELFQQVRDHETSHCLNLLEKTAPDKRVEKFNELLNTHLFTPCERIFFSWVFNLFGDDPERKIGHAVNDIALAK